MNLSPEQQAAVNSDARNICMIAGPGSGKTRTLIERTKRLVADGDYASTMVCITFTNEAANELKKRSELEFNYCGTLHGYMLRLLEQFGRRIGFRDSIAVISEDIQREILTETRERTGNKSGTVKELQAALDLGPYELDRMRNIGSISKAETTALAYYQRLLAESMVDFDSILHFGLELISKLDENDLKVLFLFVDEFQDSAPIDAKIYEALPIMNKFYVGDVDQSIYKFRGGCVENMLSLSKRDDVEVLYLEDNYRSDIDITFGAQNLIEHNTNRPQKVTRSVSKECGKVMVSDYPIEDEELLELAQRINALPDPNEVAVLVRYTKLVDYFKGGLAGYGVKIPRQRHEYKPADWGNATLLLSLLCDPENSKLSHRWMAATQGKEAADKARLASMREFETINTLYFKFPLDVTPNDAMQLMAKNGISEESISRVRYCAQSLGANDSLPQLVSSVLYDPPHEQQDGVTVCTMHKAKGREWDHVFLPAFENGNIPSESKTADIEEDRRLAFVAMTRARHTLTISHAGVRSDMWKSGEKVMPPSRFIEEMGF